LVLPFLWSALTLTRNPRNTCGSQARAAVGGLLLRKLSLLAMWLLLEDCLDNGGLFGCAGAEVAGRGVEGRVTEQGLDLRDVGATLA